MLVVAICLREIPDRALRLVVFAAAHNRGARMLVGKFFSPLPNVADYIHHAIRAGALWMRVDGIRAGHAMAGRRRRNVRREPLVTPRIHASIGSLRCHLPLPLVRQAFAGPRCVSARILKRNPRYRPVFPSRLKCSVLPVAKKILCVVRRVVCGV